MASNYCNLPLSSMASAHYATISFFPPFANATPTSRKPLALSSLSTPSPSRRRKNYLRKKLLKTLTKPYPTTTSIPKESPSHPIIPIESPHEQQQESPSDQYEELNVSQYEEIQLSKAPEFSTRSVIRFGLYFVGAFVFQTIVAVWILGSANSDQNDGNLETVEDKIRVSELGIDSKVNNVAKSKALLNGNSSNPFRENLGFKDDGIGYVDESEMEGKIVRIQEMARAARKREKLESIKNSLNDGDGVFENGIGKEVGRRLVKLEKSLESDREKLPKSSDSYTNKNSKVENGVDKDRLVVKEANGELMIKSGKVENGVDKDNLVVKEANSALVFKKKYKFRSLTTKPSNKPKGFQRSDDSGVTKMKNSTSDSKPQLAENRIVGSNELDTLDKKQKIDFSEETNSLIKSRRELGKEKQEKKSGRKVRVHSSDSKSGLAQESSPGGSFLEAMESKEANKFSRRFRKENQNSTERSNEHEVLNRNTSSKSTAVWRKQAAEGIRDKKSDMKTDFWWLDLSYVLAILMRRCHDGEGPQGLFTLKTVPETKDNLSHTVTFEDRGDATNFCYLLHSFFEDLSDFSAEILPFSTKELNEAVKSQTMKVIVVRKGQLRLYAGQPLTDVEMALRSLVEQSSSARH